MFGQVGNHLSPMCKFFIFLNSFLDVMLCLVMESGHRKLIYKYLYYNKLRMSVGAVSDCQIKTTHLLQTVN